MGMGAFIRSWHTDLGIQMLQMMHGHSVCMGMGTFIRSWHKDLGMQMLQMVHGHSVCMGTFIRS